MSDGKITINRTLVGLLALGCLLTAGAFALGMQIGSKPEMWQAAFMRVGLLMSAFWFALPAEGREAAWKDVTPWTLLGILLAIVGLAARPKVAVPALVVLAIAGFVLRPRAKKRPEQR